MKPAKPWVEHKRVAEALANAGVRVGERQLLSGGTLRGLYAARDFACHEPVASFHGRRILRRDVEALHETDLALFELVTEYAIATPERDAHLYPDDLSVPGAHLINHSCAPNCKWAEWVRGAMVVRTRRRIASGEELTAFYGWLGVKAAYEAKSHPCACGAPYCAGTIELGVEYVALDERWGGPNLPPEEVSRRFLADIVNGVDVHEWLMRRYERESASMLIGAKSLRGVDPGAFMAKLRVGARDAVSRARCMALPSRASEARLREVARTYGVPLEGAHP